MDKCSQLNHLVGLDKYGRAFAPQAGVRPDRQVGLFFWLWIGQPAATGAYDAGALLEQENGRDILFHQDVPESPDGQQHFWGKPLWGYYDSADEWVIRRQIELLMLAGVDFIVFHQRPHLSAGLRAGARHHPGLSAGRLEPSPRRLLYPLSFSGYRAGSV